MERRCLRIGGMVIVGAVLLRLLSSGGLGSFLVKTFSDPKVASFLLYMETGYVLKQADAVEQTVPEETAVVQETIPPDTTPEQVQEKAVFSPEDAELITFYNAAPERVDTAAWLTMPLDWNLRSDTPTVLILHTHATESYTGQYNESSAYHTLDETQNMLSIGDRLAQLLTQAGINVIHDRSTHDYPSYSGSYNSSRKAAKAYLEQYPGICLILDLHRDAAEDASGNQSISTVTVDGQECARLMCVVGTNAGGLSHPNWKENMSLAFKLQAQLEKLYPGLCRPINFRTQRFNQDLSAGAMLIEVGTAGNTHPQAMLAAQYLAQGIIALANGTA